MSAPSDIPRGAEALARREVKEREIYVRYEMTVCRHYSGAGIKDECSAGVNYRKLAGEPYVGYVLRLPCTPALNRPGVEVKVCDKRECHSREEAGEQYDEMQRVIARTLGARAIVQADVKAHGFKRGRGGAGQVGCPACDGVIGYTVAAYNGHIHGRCSTEGCVSWME